MSRRRIGQELFGFGDRRGRQSSLDELVVIPIDGAPYNEMKAPPDNGMMAPPDSEMIPPPCNGMIPPG